MARLLDEGDLDGPRPGATVATCVLATPRADALRSSPGPRSSRSPRTSRDAVVAPLLWGASPGCRGCSATGRSTPSTPWSATARRDTAVRLGLGPPGRRGEPGAVPGERPVAGGLAPVVGGSPDRALSVMRRDGGDHPSPNAGHPEAAAAGALGVVLGGANSYHGPGRTARRCSAPQGERPGGRCAPGGTADPGSPRPRWWSSAVPGFGRPPRGPPVACLGRRKEGGDLTHDHPECSRGSASGRRRSGIGCWPRCSMDRRAATRPGPDSRA